MTKESTSDEEDLNAAINAFFATGFIYTDEILNGSKINLIQRSFAAGWKARDKQESK